jgi:hypothetical protein
LGAIFTRGIVSVIGIVLLGTRSEYPVFSV